MVTRAKRTNNNKWDAANMTVLGCKVKRDEADAFREACRMAGTSPNAIFKAAIDEFMRKDQQRTAENP